MTHVYYLSCIHPDLSHKDPTPYKSLIAAMLAAREHQYRNTLTEDGTWGKQEAINPNVLYYVHYAPGGAADNEYMIEKVEVTE